MIRFSALLPISAPFQISTPFECVFVSKRPYSNKRPLFQFLLLLVTVDKPMNIHPTVHVYLLLLK